MSNRLIVSVPVVHMPGNPTAGDIPLTPRVIDIVNGLAAAGYAPVYIGDLVVLEDHTEAYELEFEYIEDAATVRELADQFINCNGDI